MQGHRLPSDVRLRAVLPGRITRSRPSRGPSQHSITRNVNDSEPCPVRIYPYASTTGLPRLRDAMGSDSPLLRTPLAVISTVRLQDVLVVGLALLWLAVYRWVRVPPHLRHIPKVPILPLLRSYLSGEVEEQRVKRVILPFAEKARTNVVLVFIVGEWQVHVLEGKVRLGRA